MLHRSADGSVVARRVVTDAADSVYFAYELAIESGGQPDTFLASFRPLDPSSAGLDPAEWRIQGSAAFPPQRTIHLGESIAIPLGVAPGSGASLTDEIAVDGRPLRVEAGTLYLRDKLALGRSRLFLTMELRRRGIELTPPANQGSSPPPDPTIPGVPRQFVAADAEFKTQLFLRLSVNGGPETDLPSARGRLIWFSPSGRGRYILSLVPRPELGFVKAGEARGGYLNLQMGGDSFVLTSGASIAPAGAPYFVYALHDPEWEPAASSQRDKPQAGSVGPEEIASLRKEQVK
ncbi:MAG: hypothetical protein JO307_25295 [Bryobacterales bacterium]|nr:hypothetical protein [Bryobacterales bacterium]